MPDSDDPDDPRIARLLPQHRRDLPDPDNPSRPDLEVYARIASMQQAANRADRSPISVGDCDELAHAEADEILRRGGRPVPHTFPRPTRASGFVVMSERRGPSIVFLDPDRYPLRASLSFTHGQRLAARLRAAAGEDPEASTGPPVDDPSWQGIALERRGPGVDIRLRALGFDRDVTLEADDATCLAELLEQIVPGDAQTT